MTDIADDNWSENDDQNAENVPDGFPPGLPANIEKVGRAMMGAIKRSWRRINPFYVTGGSADAYVVSPQSNPEAINIYEMIRVRSDRTNTTTTPTLKYGGATARNIKKIGASGKIAVAVGDILAGRDHGFWYDGTDFILSNPSIADASLSSGLLKVANNLSDVASASTSRTNLGLGSAAVQDVSYFATAAQGTKADGALQKASNLSDVLNASTALANIGGLSNAAGAVGTTNLAANAVTTTKITDANVTLAKLDTAAYGTSGANKLLQLDGSGKLPAVDGSQLTGLPVDVAYGQIYGFLPSSIAGTSTTASMTISAGQAAESGNTAYISKGTSTSWAVSNGNAINGYQGGTTLPNSSTIHVFMCSGTSGTGSFASTSLTPTLPTGYTTYYRRVFSFQTNASGAPIAYTAIETEGGSLVCYLATQVLDINGNSTTTAALATLSVPTGVKMGAMIRAITTTAAYQGVLFTSPDETDVAPTISGSGGFNATAPGFDLDSSTSAGLVVVSPPNLITNTSGQIRHRATATTAIQVVSKGWKDFRRS